MGRTEGGSSAAYGTLQMVRGSYRPSLKPSIPHPLSLVNSTLPSKERYPPTEVVYASEQMVYTTPLREGRGARSNREGL